MSGRQRAWIHGSAWIVGGVLLLAGILKVGRPLEFGRAIEGYQLLPSLWVPTVATWLPWLEVACGALLCANRWRSGAALLASALGAGFLVAGLSVLLRGLEADCGCFGAWSGPVGALTLVIECVYLAAALLALRGALDQSPESCTPS